MASFHQTKLLMPLNWCNFGRLPDIANIGLVIKHSFQVLDRFDNRVLLWPPYKHQFPFTAFDFYIMIFCIFRYLFYQNSHYADEYTSPKSYVFACFQFFRLMFVYNYKYTGINEKQKRKFYRLFWPRYGC